MDVFINILRNMMYNISIKFKYIQDIILISKEVLSNYFENYF